jgi:hypothetical protein
VSSLRSAAALQAACLERFFQAGARLPERGALSLTSEDSMVPLLRMLEFRGLSLTDAEAAGFHLLAAAAQRCRRCMDRDACVRWLKWQGRYGRAPLCPNAPYMEELKERRRPD